MEPRGAMFLNDETAARGLLDFAFRFRRFAKAAFALVLFHAHEGHHSGKSIPLIGKGGALHNKSRRTNSVRKYATSIRRSPIWNILLQSALSITLRHDGLLRIVQKDVPNWRLASADCVSGHSLRFVVQSP